MKLLINTLFLLNFIKRSANLMETTEDNNKKYQVIFSPESAEQLEQLCKVLDTRPTQLIRLATMTYVLQQKDLMKQTQQHQKNRLSNSES